MIVYLKGQGFVDLQDETCYLILSWCGGVEGLFRAVANREKCFKRGLLFYSLSFERVPHNYKHTISLTIMRCILLTYWQQYDFATFTVIYLNLYLMNSDFSNCLLGVFFQYSTLETFSSCSSAVEAHLCTSVMDFFFFFC